MTHTPTPEQENARQMFRSGESLAIEAGAGTGKTATLQILAEDAPERRGQYVAFNKAIVEESKVKMPSNVRCNTAHSLAFQAVGKQYADRLRNSARMKSLDIAAAIGINESIKVTKFDGSPKTLGRGFLAGLAMRAVTRFCQSADPEPTRRHVPWIDGLDAPAGDRARVRTNNDLVARAIEPAMRRAWEDLRRVDGSLPFKHDVYLKLYQLSDPRIEADFILFDEAQDANPVMAAIVAAQTHAQLVYVGDSQQEIYGFTGAVNTLSTIDADRRAFLTRSFRFGPAIAEMANRVLAMIPSAELRLTGTESIDSVVESVENPSVVLTRTNAEAVRTLLGALSRGLTVHLVGGSAEIAKFARGARDLMAGKWTSHPELTCFDSWAEVQEYVELDEQGGDLRLMVSLIDEFGVEQILSALGRETREDEADLIVSTAHKSKGREWAAVKLGPDFTIQRDGERRIREGDEEKRLLYVAVTRAQLRLDVTAIAILDETVEAVAETPENSSCDATDGVSDARDGLRRFLDPDVHERRQVWTALGGTDETYRVALSVRP